MSVSDSPTPTLCQNCKKRPGAVAWVGDGGSLAYIHGLAVYWCKVCVLEAQIAHCRKMADELPILEQKLQAEIANG